MISLHRRHLTLIIESMSVHNRSMHCLLDLESHLLLLSGNWTRTINCSQVNRQCPTPTPSQPYLFATEKHIFQQWKLHVRYFTHLCAFCEVQKGNGSNCQGELVMSSTDLPTGRLYYVVFLLQMRKLKNMVFLSYIQKTPLFHQCHQSGSIDYLSTFIDAPHNMKSLWVSLTRQSSHPATPVEELQLKKEKHRPMM